MERLNFDSGGNLVGVDGGEVSPVQRNRRVSLRKESNETLDIFSDREKDYVSSGNLKKSEDLDFLKENNEEIKDAEREYWSLYSKGEMLRPLEFSNGKTQEDIVEDVVKLAQNGEEVIFIHGMCGTGKSAIALNIARKLGRASIVVPVKALQKQYEEDYTGKLYVLRGGKRMKIAMITGRDNHDSIIEPGKSCADPYLPDTIKITDKNVRRLREYYEENPLISQKSKSITDVRSLKRISIAPSNPYWSPIVNSVIELNQLRDAQKKRYMGLEGNEFIFYHRKGGCSYYDQFQSYLDADVIIFNSAKYKIEVNLNRKPETDVEIIDEGDEFLDSFSTQKSLNLSLLSKALQMVSLETDEARNSLRGVDDLIDLEEQRARAIGVDEKKIFHIKETGIEKILRGLLSNVDIESEILVDDMNYGNKAIEVAKDFIDFFEDTYVSYRKDGDDLYVNLVTVDLSKRFGEIRDKSKLLILMSGTLHSPEVLRKVFGIERYKVVEAETRQQGIAEIIMTGKEFDCRYSNFGEGKKSKKDYFLALKESLNKAERPYLVQVNAFDDLPSEEDIINHELGNTMTKDRLRSIQREDKTGRAISLFKSGMNEELFSTKCSRGVDFPGDVCRSVIFTKYPNPNVNGTFWKVLMKTHPEYFWDFYKDKARREFLQRLYRALRSKKDHVYVLSPDLRVLNAVRGLQNA
jgi:Rad3-related DNA helicase